MRRIGPLFSSGLALSDHMGSISKLIGLLLSDSLGSWTSTPAWPSVVTLISFA